MRRMGEGLEGWRRSPVTRGGELTDTCAGTQGEREAVVKSSRRHGQTGATIGTGLLLQ